MQVAQSAMSSAFIIRARAAASGTTGRRSSNGVDVARKIEARTPFWRSSQLMAWSGQPCRTCS
jgi:hypothetical protein